MVRRGKEAGLPEEITLEGLRDAGATVGTDADSTAVHFSMGHKAKGMTDNYVLRQATSKGVEKISKALERYYFGKTA